MKACPERGVVEEIPVPDVSILSVYGTETDDADIRLASLDITWLRYASIG